MEQYRPLTEREIDRLEAQYCTAEDWTAIQVAEDFMPSYLHHVDFYGEVTLGVFEQQVEVAEGLYIHSGINHAVLRNVKIGDNCFISRIGTFINNYVIGNRCVLMNIGTLSTTEGATFGEGNTIAVGNEAGDGNILLSTDLTSQLAALMMRYHDDKDIMEGLTWQLRESIRNRKPERGWLGDGCKIANTGEIVNCIVGENTEINGAQKLVDCTFVSTFDTGVYIGTGVICENTIVTHASSVTNGVCLQDCFVGEACRLSNGFTAQASVFFANSMLSCGEAVATYCGPFTGSHHKSSLLIAAEMAFYNAGSGTNFSNHAYKMGPLHHGKLQRGCKTGSGTHIVWPARIGAYSACIGKIDTHPNTETFPFSYVIGHERSVKLVPGRNFVSAGFFRDVTKWPKRDTRPNYARKSIIRHEWLTPAIMDAVWQGRSILISLLPIDGEQGTDIVYKGLSISGKGVETGIHYYNMLLQLFMGEVTKSITAVEEISEILSEPLSLHGIDLGGMYISETDLTVIVNDIASGHFNHVKEVEAALKEADRQYQQNKSKWALQLARKFYNCPEEDLLAAIRNGYEEAHKNWINALQKDAEKEFELGDVKLEVYQSFLETLSSYTAKPWDDDTNSANTTTYLQY